MKKVISASRRTDLVSFFPDWLASAIKKEKVRVYGPSGRTYSADLSPDAVHTFVLWSKNFSNLVQNRKGLHNALCKYEQLYFHFTITGLGGSFIERGAPLPSDALTQLDPLIDIAGKPERISVRFDPVVYWRVNGKVKTNLPFFEKLVPELGLRNIKDVRISFAQWYRKAIRRAESQGFQFVDPSAEEKKNAACALASLAGKWNIHLYSCSQDFLSEVPGISSSACINGQLLSELHSFKEAVSTRKDGSQRPQCRCTESVDIGSYTQFCPHSCLYCYANPKI